MQFPYILSAKKTKLQAIIMQTIAEFGESLASDDD